MCFKRLCLSFLVAALCTRLRETAAWPLDAQSVKPSTMSESSRVITFSSVAVPEEKMLSKPVAPPKNVIGESLPTSNTHRLPPSPANLLKPDGFQFYTYDERGDMITRRMTVQEIQALIASGGPDHSAMDLQEPQNADDILTGGKKVMDVVQKVQNVLKSALGKPSPSPTLSVPVPTIPEQANVEWSNILPAILAGETASESTSEVAHVIPADTNPFTEKVTDTSIANDLRKSTIELPKEEQGHHTTLNVAVHTQKLQTSTLAQYPSAHPAVTAYEEKPMIPIVMVTSKPDDVFRQTTVSPLFQKVNELAPTENSSTIRREQPGYLDKATTPMMLANEKITTMPAIAQDGYHGETTTTKTIVSYTSEKSVVPENFKVELASAAPSTNDYVDLLPSTTRLVSPSTQTTKLYATALDNASTTKSSNERPDDSPAPLSTVLVDSLSSMIGQITEQVSPPAPSSSVDFESYDIAKTSIEESGKEKEKDDEKHNNGIEWTPWTTVEPLEMRNKTSDSDYPGEQEDYVTHTPGGDMFPESATLNEDIAEFVNVSSDNGTSDKATIASTLLPAITSLVSTVSSVPIVAVAEAEVTDSSLEPSSEFDVLKNPELTTERGQAEPNESTASIEFDETIGTTAPNKLGTDTMRPLGMQIVSVANESATSTSSERPTSSPPLHVIENIIKSISTHATVPVTEALALPALTEDFPKKTIASGLIAGFHIPSQSGQVTKFGTSDEQVRLVTVPTSLAPASATGNFGEKEDNTTAGGINLLRENNTSTQTFLSGYYNETVSAIPPAATAASEAASTMAGLPPVTQSEYLTSRASVEFNGNLLDTIGSTTTQSTTTAASSLLENSPKRDDVFSSSESFATSANKDGAESTTEREPASVSSIVSGNLTVSFEDTSKVVPIATKDSTEEYEIADASIQDGASTEIVASDILTEISSSKENVLNAEFAGGLISTTLSSSVVPDNVTNFLTKGPPATVNTVETPDDFSAIAHTKSSNTKSSMKDESSGWSSTNLPGIDDSSGSKVESKTETEDNWQLVSVHKVTSSTLKGNDTAGGIELANEAHSGDNRLTETTAAATVTVTTTRTTTTTTTTTAAAAGTAAITTASTTAASRVPLEASQSVGGLDTSTRNTSDDIVNFSRLCNGLAFKFWVATNKGLSSTRSLVLSPFGVTSLLAMIFLGARGTTSDQMNEILGLDNVATFNPHLIFQNVTDAVSLARQQQGIANAAFVRELFADKAKVRKLMPFYKEQAQQFYEGLVTEVNFATISDLARRRTNLLIRKQTGGRIKDFVKSNAVPLRSPLAAISANAFQTDCNSSMASTVGRDGEFYFAVSSTVRLRKLIPLPATVWRTNVLAGYEPSLDATAIALGPLGKLVSTIFLVPGQQGHAAPGDTLDRLEHRFLAGDYANEAWEKLLKVLIPRPGLELQLPKFSHRSMINATAALKRMGLELLFSDRADLKGINGIGNRLYLSDVLQMNLFSTCGDESISNGRHHVETYPATSPSRGARRYIEEIDESKSTSDSSQNSPRSKSISSRATDEFPDEVSSKKPRLKLDQPFLYFVRHNPTGLILHMGRFNPRLLP